MHDIGSYLHIGLCFIHICLLMNMGLNTTIGWIRNLDLNFYVDNCPDASINMNLWS